MAPRDPMEDFRATEQPLTPESFAALIGVSRETLERLLAYDRLLLDWSDRHNLVARSTLPDRWRRHFLDSAQLYPLIPASAKTLVDLGSGAGFPGLVLAALGAERALRVTLVESIGKKAAFLAAAAEAMGLQTLRVVSNRIENAGLPAPDVVTARALAPLPKLLELAAAVADGGTICLFLKGQDVETELTEATKSWKIEAVRHPSRTSEGASILEVTSFRPATRARGEPDATAHSRHRQPEGRSRQDDDGDQSRHRARRRRRKGSAGGS